MRVHSPIIVTLLFILLFVTPLFIYGYENSRKGQPMDLPTSPRVINDHSAAKRQAPVSVEPVEYQGFQYTAQPFSMDKNNPYMGGHVQAHDTRTGQLVWDKAIYDTERTDSSLEGDVQDLFITKLAIVNDALVATDEKGDTYKLNTLSGELQR